MKREWSYDKVSVTVSKLSVYFPLKIRCFQLHDVVLCLSNVNVNAPLTQFYGFCKVTFADKACTVIVIYAFDISRTCTNDGFK